MGGAVNYTRISRIDEKTERPKSKDLGWRRVQNALVLELAYL